MQVVTPLTLLLSNYFMCVKKYYLYLCKRLTNICYILNKYVCLVMKSEFVLPTKRLST